MATKFLDGLNEDPVLLLEPRQLSRNGIRRPTEGWEESHLTLPPFAPVKLRIQGLLPSLCTFYICQLNGSVESGGACGGRMSRAKLTICAPGADDLCN